MLRRWLGDADFARGLHAYFENTNTATPLVVTFGMLLVKHQDVMSQPSWILGLEQPGYPVLTVKVENDVLKDFRKTILYR